MRWAENSIPESYRTRGQRYDDLLTRRQQGRQQYRLQCQWFQRQQGQCHKQSWLDKLGDWLWGDNDVADRVAVVFCVLAAGYFVAALVRAL